MTKKKVAEISTDEVSNRLSTALGLGVDIEGRRVFLVGEINHEMSYRIVTAVRVLDEYHGPIYITLNSNGGAESDGYAIYDALRVAKNKVVIEAFGAVQSIAAAILQAADVRRVAPECRFMIHNGSVGLHGDIDVDAVAAINREIQDHTGRYHRLLANRSGLKIETIQKMCKEETFLDAESAVKHGFADEVIKYAI